MTDKRFRVETIEEELYPMPVYYDGNKKLGYVEIIHLLNKLHEENQLLKLQSETKLFSRRELEKENEQLKHSIKCLEADKMELQQYIKRMQGDVE